MLRITTVCILFAAIIVSCKPKQEGGSSEAKGWGFAAGSNDPKTKATFSNGSISVSCNCSCLTKDDGDYEVVQTDKYAYYEDNSVGRFTGEKLPYTFGHVLQLCFDDGYAKLRKDILQKGKKIPAKCIDPFIDEGTAADSEIGTEEYDFEKGVLCDYKDQLHFMRVPYSSSVEWHSDSNRNKTPAQAYPESLNK